MALGFYSPSDVIVIIGGVVKVGGFAGSTFIEITKDLQSYQSRRTPDGTTARLYIKDRTYSIKFTLAQSSESNALLTQIQQMDEITQRGFFPLIIKDGKGSSLLFSPTAWIEGLPSQGYGEDLGIRIWSIKATDCTSYVGGNESSSNVFEDLLKTALSSSQQLGELL